MRGQHTLAEQHRVKEPDRIEWAGIAQGLSWEGEACLVQEQEGGLLGGLTFIDCLNDKVCLPQGLHRESHLGIGIWAHISSAGALSHNVRLMGKAGSGWGLTSCDPMQGGLCAVWDKVCSTAVEGGKLLLLTCMSVALLILLAAESACSCVSCCFPTSLLRHLLVVAMLRSRAAECMSHNITSSPFMAASCAMPPPICPAAGTPGVVIRTVRPAQCMDPIHY